MTRRPVIRRYIPPTTESDERQVGALLLTIAGIVAVVLGAVLLGISIAYARRRRRERARVDR